MMTPTPLACINPNNGISSAVNTYTSPVLGVSGNHVIKDDQLAITYT